MVVPGNDSTRSQPLSAEAEVQVALEDWTLARARQLLLPAEAGHPCSKQLEQVSLYEC